MRITGGMGRGRRLKGPSGKRIRPTSEKVKQALFNILSDKIGGAVFLDLFAGAGGIGIEAISRGAARAVFVDASKDAVRLILANIQAADFADRAVVIHSGAEAFLKRGGYTFDIVFLDPPYAEDLEPLLRMISEADILSQDGIVVAERFKKQSSVERAGGLALFREARYGDTVLAFYSQRA